MSAAEEMTALEINQKLIADAKKKAEELRALIERLIDPVAQGVATPVPPRPKLEVIGDLASGISSVLAGVNCLVATTD